MSGRRLGVIAAAAGLVGYLSTGLTAVPQDEVGVIRRFGAVLPEPWPAGLHLGLPWGLDRVDRVARDRARTVSVGARGLTTAPLGRAPDPAGDDFLTGDLNLVAAEAQIQFLVTRPAAYLFSARSADATLAALGESALARGLAGRSVDDVLTAGRAGIAERVRRDVQAGADAQGLGVSVRAVRLVRVAPPAPVAPAFADAARARSDRRQAVTRAEEYQDRARSDARGQARETADRATARADALVQSARGEAGRFARLVAGVRNDPVAARRRMYLDALAELLPRFARKVVVAPGRDVDVSVIADP